MNFIAFPSIESFYHVVKYAQSTHQQPIVYQAKIKLHGTNTGVTVNNEQVCPQSANKTLTQDQDHFDFFKSIDRDYFRKLPNCTVFGEWCGPGIMTSTTAINKIPERIFAVFAVKSEENHYIIEPDEINALLPSPPENVYVLPWYGDPFVVDFSLKSTLRKIAENLSLIVDQIENQDPWVKQLFNVDGHSEGLVFYPKNAPFENFVFKAKGEKHKVVNTKNTVQIDPEIAKSVHDFVSLFVTEARLEQGLTNVKLDIKNIAQFIKWMCNDVKKESSLELSSSHLTWEMVEKYVAKSARKWFLQKINQI